jgi:hypothetical protein
MFYLFVAGLTTVFKKSGWYRASITKYLQVISIDNQKVFDLNDQFFIQSIKEKN